MAFSARGRTVPRSPVRERQPTISNQPNAAANHFHALCEALLDLRGVALFDRFTENSRTGGSLEWLVWERREFENHVATRQTLERYAAAA